MSDGVTPLYDYDAIRGIREASIFTPALDVPTLVLGSTQAIDTLERDRLGDVHVRRRRGGGGMVLLRPQDVWVDWWIPCDDGRWDLDVRDSAARAGHWWRDALGDFTDARFTVHDGPLEGDESYRLVCFAGKGPGEVFLEGRKVVGVTQWRVREGVLLSSVLHARGARDVMALLASPPKGLDGALDHHTLASLALPERESLLETIADQGGPWVRRSPLFP